MDRQSVDVDRFGVKAVEQGPQRADTAVARQLQGELVFVAAHLAEGASGRFELARSGEPQVDVSAGNEALELVRGALGDELAVIVQCLYEWSAEELCEPCLLELVRDGNPIYAWPFEQRHVWRTPKMKLAGRVLERITRAR